LSISALLLPVSGTAWNMKYMKKGRLEGCRILMLLRCLII
jgi:hypothetical protein